MTDPFFSVIVPTFGRAPQLAACLESVARLDYPNDRVEVIVVDDGNPVKPEVRLNRFPCRVVTRPHGGPGHARNTGAAAAQGEYLAFTGDDCCVDAGWLRALAAEAVRSPRAGLGGTVRHGLPGDRYATASHALVQYMCATTQGDATTRFFTPNNFATPAEGFRAIGGFDPRFDFAAGEDRDFCARWQEHGFPLIATPDAVVEHQHPQTLMTFVRQHFRYGRGSRVYRERLRARTGHGSVERLRFYRDLVRCVPRGEVQLLLALAQVVNACGYGCEALRRRRVTS